jgi:hypothetical protein
MYTDPLIPRLELGHAIAEAHKRLTRQTALQLAISRNRSLGHALRTPSDITLNIPSEPRRTLRFVPSQAEEPPIAEMVPGTLSCAEFDVDGSLRK